MGYRLNQTSASPCRFQFLHHAANVFPTKPENSVSVIRQPAIKQRVQTHPTSKRKLQKLINWRMSTGEHHFRLGQDRATCAQSSASHRTKRWDFNGSASKQNSAVSAAGSPPTSEGYAYRHHTDIGSQLQEIRKGLEQTQLINLPSGDTSQGRRPSQNLLSKDVLPGVCPDHIDRLSSIHHPPASLPSFAQGNSLPQGVTEPPLKIGALYASLPSTHEADSGGGFEADFLTPLEDKHKCPICLLALREPVQTNCGHRFCQSCIKQVSRMPHPQCPLDKEGLEKVFPDNFCKREILALSVRCMNAIAGCCWTGQLRELKLHLDSCSFTLVLCLHWDRGCRHRMLQARLQQHIESDCEYRDCFCTHCQSTLPLKDLEIPDHIKHVCEKMVLQCDFSTVGCQFQGDRSSMKRHLEVSQGYHLTLAVERTSVLEQQVSKLNDKMQERDTTVARLDDQCHRLEHQFAEMTKKMVELEQSSGRWNKLEIQANKVEGLLDAGISMTQPVEAVNSSTVSAITKEIDEAARKMSQVEAEVSTVQQKITSVESKMATIDHQIADANMLLGRTDAILAEFDLRLLSQETTSFAGVLLWKIPDFNRHFEEAQTGKKPSLYSPPFYTSRYGYKLCARVYLYGDGVGKSSHISVFFVVMKGEFDALLAWPFHQKVTLTLLDQAPGKRHISDTFMPDPSSSSFQRPSSEMNIASGCPRFVTIETLRTANAYVKDNTIFLRVAVDCPGLPTY